MSQPSSAPPSCEVIVLTTLSMEYKAALNHLLKPQLIKHPSGTLYHTGQVAGLYRTWRVAIAGLGQDAAEAANATEKALAYFDPQIVLFVGTAAGLPGVCCGDVVVANQLTYTNPRHPTTTGAEIWRASFVLEQRSRVEARWG